jgi:hypothetical protein
MMETVFNRFLGQKIDTRSVSPSSTAEAEGDYTPPPPPNNIHHFSTLQKAEKLAGLQHKTFCRVIKINSSFSRLAKKSR